MRLFDFDELCSVSHNRQSTKPNLLASGEGASEFIEENGGGPGVRLRKASKEKP